MRFIDLFLYYTYTYYKSRAVLKKAFDVQGAAGRSAASEKTHPPAARMFPGRLSANLCYNSFAEEKADGSFASYRQNGTFNDLQLSVTDRKERY